MAAIVIDYTSFNAQLIRQIGADSGAIGAGVADRAVQLLNQWAILDPQFDAWAKTRGTPWKESAVWHFAQTIILDPVAQWLDNNIVCIIQVHN